MKVILTDELKQGIAAHIAANLVVKGNKAGTGEYLTINPDAANVDDISGYAFRVNFATMGMKASGDVSVNRAENARKAVSKLSPEAKAALLAELAQ